MKTLRVALTGAHGVGKTTLGTRLLEEMKASGADVRLTTEVSRTVCDIVDDPEFFRRRNNLPLRQALLLYGQLLFEDLAADEDADIIVCDRSIVDHWAYSLALFKEEFAAEGVVNVFAHFVAEHARRYGKIFYVPIEFPPEDDGTRESDPHYQREIDAKITDFLRQHSIPYETITGSLEARVASIVQSLEDCLVKIPR